jgi:hypothetical protein
MPLSGQAKTEYQRAYMRRRRAAARESGRRAVRRRPVSEPVDTGAAIRAMTPEQRDEILRRIRGS